MITSGDIGAGGTIGDMLLNGIVGNPIQIIVQLNTNISQHFA
jgi:hypothetical protein